MAHRSVYKELRRSINTLSPELQQFQSVRDRYQHFQQEHEGAPPDLSLQPAFEISAQVRAIHRNAHGTFDVDEFFQQQPATQTSGTYRDPALPQDAQHYSTHGGSAQYQQSQQYAQPTHNKYVESFAQQPRKGQRSNTQHHNPRVT